jgi:hypothetical protein
MPRTRKLSRRMTYLCIGHALKKNFGPFFHNTKPTNFFDLSGGMNPNSYFP